MSWGSDDGQHEGYVVPVFADGMTGGSSSSEGISASADAEGNRLAYADWQWRPYAEVVGWVVACDCAAVSGRVGWTGFRWERVEHQADEDVAAGRLYADPAGYDAADVDDREDVHSLAMASLARPRGG